MSCWSDWHVVGVIGAIISDEEVIIWEDAGV